MTPPAARAVGRDALPVIAIAALVPFAALAIWARLASPAAWEPAAMVALAVQPGVAGDVVRAINTLGDLPVWTVVVAVLSGLALVLRGLVAAALVVVSAASDLAAFAVKLLVGRERPATAAAEHFFGPDSFAYPSGHVVRAVALAAVVVWLLAGRRSRVPAAAAAAVVAAVVMGYARVAMGVHWPTDAVGGALLGLGWFSITAWLAGRRR